jgi:hypothetical protein
MAGLVFDGSNSGATMATALDAGTRAESRVFTALAGLPAPWRVFPTVEWRLLAPHGGEQVGEADVVVFHPQLGLAVIEIKAGAVQVRDGHWYYASGRPMKQSPFAQARRNRYALLDKLRQRLGRALADGLAITHAAWFPDVIWRGTLPGADAPSRAFVLDRTARAQPAAALERLLREACPHAQPWTPAQQHALNELLAPDCRHLVPLATQVDDAVADLLRATDQQVAVLRLLRTQRRLLVEGGAGTGKTVLACALAREHAALGRTVLLTCFNMALARFLAASLAGVPGITVRAFHDLAREHALAAGLPYAVPTEPEAQARFYRESSAEWLLQAAEQGGARFDTLVVDEAADFAPTWWVALQALGAPGFSWYCFYDRSQCLFQRGEAWEPPFAAEPLPLDDNLRNTRPIGEWAARLGGCAVPQRYRVEQGEAPRVLACRDADDMAAQLRRVLRDLLGAQALRPEQVAVLSPYRPSQAAATWARGLDGVAVSDDLAAPVPGRVRVGTVQGFKGLEADVIILAGIDSRCLRHPATLYVGASRARALLVILTLDDVVLPPVPPVPRLPPAAGSAAPASAGRLPPG